MTNYAIILAAGKGTRMKSDLPKVLHKVAGISMLEHVFRSVSAIVPERPWQVVGHKAELVEQVLQVRQTLYVRLSSWEQGMPLWWQSLFWKIWLVRRWLLLATLPDYRRKSENLIDFHVNHKNVATILTAEAG